MLKLEKKNSCISFLDSCLHSLHTILLYYPLLNFRLSSLTHICMYVCMHALYTRFTYEREDTPVFIYLCVHYVLGLHYEREDAHVFSFLVWFHSLNYTSKFIILPESFMNSSPFFSTWIILPFEYVPHLQYPVICQ